MTAQRQADAFGTAPKNSIRALLVEASWRNEVMWWTWRAPERSREIGWKSTRVKAELHDALIHE